MKRPSATDEVRDGAGNDRVLDDLERDILGAVRGVVTEFVAKRVGRPDLSDVDVDIELPTEAGRNEQHQPHQHVEPEQQDRPEAPDPGPEEPVPPAARRFGAGTALLPLLLIFSFGVFVLGGSLFYNYVIVGEIPLVNGTKLQSIAVERQRTTEPGPATPVGNSALQLTGTIAESSPNQPPEAAEKTSAPPKTAVGGWVTTTTPSAEIRLESFAPAGSVERD